MMIAAENISKRFDRKLIFKNLSLKLNPSETLAITGSNGSGKSTLLKVLASLIEPSSGSVTYTEHQATIDKIEFRKKIGLVSPYLHFYEDLTGMETIEFSLTAKGSAINMQWLEQLFDYFAIASAKDQLVKTYSSGMIQRLRFIQAIASKPIALFLDEPTSTLDEAGKLLIWNKLHELRPSSIIIIASNDQHEINFCNNAIAVHDYQ